MDLSGRWGVEGQGLPGITAASEFGARAAAGPWVENRVRRGTPGRAWVVKEAEGGRGVRATSRASPSIDGLRARRRAPRARPPEPPGSLLRGAGGTDRRTRSVRAAQGQAAAPRGWQANGRGPHEPRALGWSDSRAEAGGTPQSPARRPEAHESHLGKARVTPPSSLHPAGREPIAASPSANRRATRTD